SPRLSAMPKSSKALGVMRPFGFGLSIFLKEGHSDGGIVPRDEGCGGLYGGLRNGGCYTLGLNKLNINKASAYASIAAIGPLQNIINHLGGGKGKRLLFEGSPSSSF